MSYYVIILRNDERERFHKEFHLVYHQEFNMAQKSEDGSISSRQNNFVVNVDSFSMTQFPDRGLHTTARIERRPPPGKKELAEIDQKLANFFANNKTKGYESRDSRTGDMFASFMRPMKPSAEKVPTFEEPSNRSGGKETIYESNNGTIKTARPSSAVPQQPPVAALTAGGGPTKLNAWDFVRQKLSTTIAQLASGVSAPKKSAKDLNPLSYDPEELNAPPGGWSVTLPMLSALKGMDAVTPMLWIVMRALTVILFVYHEERIKNEEVDTDEPMVEALWDTFRLQVRAL